MNLRLLVAIGAASLLFVPDLAHACSPPKCYPSIAPRGGNLPGNALAIPYLAGSEAPSFRLVDGQGAEITTTVKADAWTGGKLLVPTEPLPAGKVDLVWTETCNDAGEMRRSFSVGSDVVRPTSIGTLKAVNRQVGAFSVNTSSGSCIRQVQAVTFDLTIDPSLELRAYREVTAYKVSIDGEEVKSPYYGASVEADDGPLRFATLHAVCGDRTSFDDNGPSIGVHTVSVQAHVAGAASDPPPVKINVNFSCTDATEPPAPNDDRTPAGGPPPNTTPPVNSGTVAPPVPASANATAPESRPLDGCNASPSASGSPFALLALVAAVTRWRRKAAALSPSRAASRKT